MRDELLFYGGADMYAVVQAQTEAVKKSIQDVVANQLLNASEEDLVADLVSQFWLHVPTLKEDEIHIAEASETMVDVRHDGIDGLRTEAAQLTCRATAL